jgi:hypothetical protein
MIGKRLGLLLVCIFLGLFTAWLSQQLAAGTLRAASQDVCDLRLLAPAQPELVRQGPFSQPPALLYESPEALQLGPWHADGERVLLVENRSDHRQAVLTFNPSHGSIVFEGLRRPSNSRPFWQGESAVYLDWTEEAGAVDYVVVSEGVVRNEAWLDSGLASGALSNLRDCSSAPEGIEVLSAAWSHDGKQAALVVNGTRPGQARGRGAEVLSTRLLVLDLDAGTQQEWLFGPEFQPGQRYVTDVAWQPGTDVLAAIVLTGLDVKGFEASALYFLDLAAGTALQAPAGDLIGGGDWGRQLAWSPDGAVLLANCPTRRTGRLCGYGLTGPKVSPPEPFPIINLPISPPRNGTYTPPISVTVEMYRLNNSGAVRQPAVFCTPGDTSYGCTSFCSESGFGCPESVILDYPFESPTVTVPIENGYLRDVVPQEMGTYYDQNALEAQAVAARTFAYYNIENPFSVHFNNSISFQAFIPRRLERLLPVNYPDDADNRWDDPCGADIGSLNTAQRIICSALASPDWMAYLGFPIKAHFAADIPGHTNSSSRPYILGLPDPISTACDSNLAGHGWGMSQEGASRWGRGSECSYPGAPVYSGNQPGGPWSVGFNRDQILAHYYSLIQIQSQSDEQLSPDNRWLPIHAGWGTGDGLPPPTLGLSGTVLLDLRIQNAGTTTWITGTTGLLQTWTGVSGTYTTVQPLSAAIAPPGMLTLTLPIQAPPFAPTGSYTVTLDMALETGSSWTPFAQLEPDRPWYTLVFSTLVADLREWVALPVVVEAPGQP